MLVLLFFAAKFRQEKGGVLVAFVTPVQEFGGGYLEEWSTFSCRGIFVQTLAIVGVHFAGPLNQRGHVGRLFFTNNTVFGGHAGGLRLPQKGGGFETPDKEPCGWHFVWVSRGRGGQMSTFKAM